MAKPMRKSDKDGLYQRKNSAYWYVSYTDGSGKRTRRSTGTADRKEAEALLAKWRLEAHRERQWDEQPTRTFDELMLAYLQETQDSKRSPERDRYALKQLYPFFTERELWQRLPTRTSALTSSPAARRGSPRRPSIVSSACCRRLSTMPAGSGAGKSRIPPADGSCPYRRAGCGG